MDNNLLIKAKEQGIQFYKLDDEYKLSKELSKEEKTIRELQKELNLYKNRKPNPVVHFK